MSSPSLFRTFATLSALAGSVTMPGCIRAQAIESSRHDIAQASSGPSETLPDSAIIAPNSLSPHTYSFKSRRDSLAWEHARSLAEHAKGFHLVVSLQDRHLWALMDDDTLLSAPAAVAKGNTLDFAGREWTFDTPRGIRHVLGKEADPVWIPPEWLYAETALEHGLKLAKLEAGHPHKLSDGRYLTVRDSVVGVLDGGEFLELPTDEHIVFDNTLFIPPTSTKNRHVEGELGKYRLNLGDGYLLHGTPYKDSIGMAATHGCVRLDDADIEWLYDHVPVGTRVYIY